MQSLTLYDVDPHNDTVVRAWVSPPNTRGTSDILYTCIVTIVLCVYTAVHLNIPPPGERFYWQWLRRAKWTAFGIFAPEIVLFTALQQFQEARGLAAFLNREEEKQHSDTRPPQRSPLYLSMLDWCSDMYITLFPDSTGAISKKKSGSFDLRYGFFVQMGGLRANVESLIHEHESMCLEASVLKHLARRGAFFHIDQRSIDDRSKADSFAKLVVCVQVSWMLVQSVTRAFSSYSLTLLEIHTFVHVVCAIGMYGLWFKKPFGVAEAIFVDLNVKQKEDIAIFSLLRLAVRDASQPLLGRPSALHYRYDPPLDETAVTFSIDPNVLLRGLRTTTQAMPENVCDWPRAQPVNPSITISDPAKSTVEKLGHYSSDRWPKNLEVYNAAAYSEHGEPLLALSMDAKCPVQALLPLSGCSAAFRPIFDMAFEAAMHDKATGLPAYTKTASAFSWRAENLAEFLLLEEFTNTVLCSLVLMCYGGIHLTAWNFHFPTKTEMWMWRWSGLLLLCTVPTIIIISAMGGIHSIFQKRNWEVCDRLLTIIAALIMMALCAGCLFSRAFIVVEAFISLRAVPISVYAVLPWSNYIPHI